MKVRAAIIIFSVFIFSVSSFSQDSNFKEVTSINELKQKLIEHSNNTNSIESSFVQEKHLWMLNEVIISKGVFLFKKKNSVRWQYNTPIEYTIVIHEGNFTIVSNDKVTEFDIESNPMFKEINKMIVTAIRGDFIDNPDFKAEFMENENQYLAKLLPTNNGMASMLTSIEIYFNRGSMLVEQVIFKEPGDDFTSIIFLDKSVNTSLSDSRFLIEKE